MTSLKPSALQGSVLTASFQQRPVGAYRAIDLEEDFGRAAFAQGVAEGRVEIADDALRGPVLRVHYPVGAVGPERGGAEWRVVLPSAHEELYCSYFLRFREGFDFVRGGKLPGLGGGAAPTGGAEVTGSNGFSARLMWRAGGAVVQYVYHPDRAGRWGDDFPYDLGRQRYFEPGRWHQVEHRVRLNSPGERDGLVQGWLDGELALERGGLRFRDVARVTVDQLLFSTFFGGNEASWAPKQDEFVDFDAFVVSRQRIGG